jgi:hypothetical protein
MEANMMDSNEPQSKAVIEVSGIDKYYIDTVRLKIRDTTNQQKFDTALAELTRLAKDYPTAPANLKSNFGAFFQRGNIAIRLVLSNENITMGDNPNVEDAAAIANHITGIYEVLAGYKRQGLKKSG